MLGCALLSLGWVIGSEDHLFRFLTLSTGFVMAFFGAVKVTAKKT
jgi:hypothetical protein